MPWNDIFTNSTRSPYSNVSLSAGNQINLEQLRRAQEILRANMQYNVYNDIISWTNVGDTANTSLNGGRMPDNIRLYYDEDAGVFAYNINSNQSVGSIGADVNQLENFYRQHSRNYNFTPAYGSSGYAELISAKQRSEEDMKSKAKLADEYSIVITYLPNGSGYGSRGSYRVAMPSTNNNNYSGTVFDFAVLEEAYGQAGYYKRELLRHQPNLPFNIWPRRNSNYYRALEQRISLTPISDYGFINLIADLKEAAKDENPDNDTKLIEKAIAYITANAFHKETFLSSNVQDFVIRYLNSINGKEYVNALSNGNGEKKLVTLNRAHKVYRDSYIERGYEWATRDYLIKNALICDGTKEWFRKGTLVELSIDNGHLHSGLYSKSWLDENGYFKCSNECNVWHHEDKGCAAYLRSPYETVYNYTRDVRSLIRKMQHLPTDKKVNGEYLRYGVELEVQARSDIPVRTASYNTGKAMRNKAIMKLDSSIGSNGFEIVTIPATLEYHRKILWDDFFNTVYTEGRTAAKSVHSWDTNVCGIHVHVTRAALTDMQLSKMLVFYHEPYNSKFLSRIAGRKVGPDAVYCKATKKKLGIYTKDHCGDHHGAIAISHHNKGKTAEVRIFRGNATHHGIMRAIEFVDATVKWCGQNSSEDALNYEKFLDWFNKPSVKSQYPELRKHLIELKYLTKRIKNDKFKHLETVPDELRTA